MKTKLMQSILMLSLVVGLFSVGAGRVEAKNQDGGPWTSSVLPFLLYYWAQNGYAGWEYGLNSAVVTILYSAEVKNISTGGVILNDGDSVPVGTQIQFQATPFRNTDIIWYGTGYSQDSPYGHWISNAGPTGIPCDSGDWTNGVIDRFGRYVDVYTPLSVNPPVVSYDHTGSTAGLSCDGSGQNCTITSPGTINGHVNFGNTYGKFYYNYYMGGCNVQYNVPMEAFSYNAWVCYPFGKSQWCQSEPRPNGSDYIINVGSGIVSFSLTAVSNNNPPATPTLSVDAPSKNINTNFVFTTSPSTDPDGDTIRYGFDFTGIAVTPGLYTPATATLASGTAQSAPYQWPTPGTYSVRVRAEDNRGGVSGWSPTISVTVNALPLNPIINSFTINGSTGSVNLLRGDMRNIAWTVSNAVSCSASSGDVWSGNKSVPIGTDLNLPANVTTPHTLDCVNVIGVHTSSTIQVNVSCTPSTGTFGTCACATETKTRTNTSALCISVVESATCDYDEKRACRNFNWTEGTP